MRGKIVTLIQRYSRAMDFNFDERKELKKKWKTLSHKQKKIESKFMKLGLTEKFDDKFI
jgi:hypothetical protein